MEPPFLLCLSPLPVFYNAPHPSTGTLIATVQHVVIAVTPDYFVVLPRIRSLPPPPTDELVVNLTAVDFIIAGTAMNFIGATVTVKAIAAGLTVTLDFKQ